MNLEPLDLTSIRHEMAPRAARVARQQKRNYDVARSGRLVSDFLAQYRTFDEELRNAPLPKIRARCRELARNDHNAKKFLSLLQKNVVGSEGVKLQSKVMLLRGQRPNQSVNGAIEDAFADWGRKDNCTITRKFTWIQVQQLVVRSVAVDGEIFVRKLFRPDNPHWFTLAFIDPDCCDFEYNDKKLPNGNTVTMGVETNGDGVPVAYHILDAPRTSYSTPLKRWRIPADEMLHIFLPESPFQTRGVPWMAAAAYPMNMRKGYQEAELTAARVAASQMGFIETDLKEDGTWQGEQSDYQGGQNLETQPGGFVAGAPGEKLSMFKPEHPVAAYEPFTTAVDRDIAGALDVAYMSLSGNLTGANYSSARIGLLDERDTYANLQTWLIEALHEPVYRYWIDKAILSSLKNVAIGDPARAYDPEWHPRSFSWVDPEKDANAEQKLVQLGFKTRSRVLAAQGYDFGETVEEWLDEVALIQDKAKQKGIDPAIVAALLTASPETIKAPSAQAAETDTPAAGAGQTPPDGTPARLLLAKRGLTDF